LGVRKAHLAKQGTIMSAQTAKVVDLAEFRLSRATAGRDEMCRMSTPEPQPLPPVVWVPVWAYVPVLGFGR